MTQNIPNPSAPAPSNYQPYQAPPSQPQKNGVGLAALIVAIVGFIFACVPGALIIGWILLPVAFILSIVGLVRSGRKKGTSIAAMIVSVVGTIVGFVVFMTVVSDAFDEAFDDAFEITNSDLSADAGENGDGAIGITEDSYVHEASDGEISEDAPEGTRQSPLTVGETVSNEDWEVTPGTPYEASEEVLAENPFNSEPEEGFEFWILPLAATYVGEDSGRPGLEITVKFVSDEGHTFNTYDPGCGVIPDDLDDVDDIYNGATAEGNTCVAVHEGANGLWTVEALFGDPVFFQAD